MRAIETLVAIILLVVVSGAALAALDGCKANWNDPIIPKPTADNPCGFRWVSCGVREDGKHGCCFEDSVCRPGGYCAFVGDSFGTQRDASAPAETPQRTPEEVRSGVGR